MAQVGPEGGAPQLAELLPLLQQGAAAAELRRVLAACAAHRLATLHQQRLRCLYRCPLITLDADADADDAGSLAGCVAPCDKKLIAFLSEYEAMVLLPLSPLLV